MSLSLSKLTAKFGLSIGMASAVLLCASSANAALLSLANTPLFLTAHPEPMVMLDFSGDEQLFHKAYTDYDDVDGDGVVDTFYKDTIDYYGYFDPQKCYSYGGTSASGYFSPTGDAGGPNKHQCNAAGGGGRWSGNFLNWATMTRMDAVRKVLYGGYRST